MNWELHDIGRTAARFIPGMFEFVQNYAHKYFSKEEADRLAEAASKRETNPEIFTQEIFTKLCNMWVQGYNDGDFKVGSESLIYPDSLDHFIEAKNQGLSLGLLTSGTYEMTYTFFNPLLQQPIEINGRRCLRFFDLIDNLYSGKVYGDKNLPETFVNVHSLITGKGGLITKIFDDKITVVNAALEGARKIGDDPYEVIMVDRTGKVKEAPVRVIRSYAELK